jgi:hypothetical protein
VSTKGAHNLQNKEIMKREQIINKIYDKIRDDLLHAKLLYWEEDDTNKYPLVDHLSSDDDISTGRDEIDNLIEQIEIEDLIDAILALPPDVPSDADTLEASVNKRLEKQEDKNVLKCRFCGSDSVAEHREDPSFKLCLKCGANYRG